MAEPNPLPERERRAWTTARVMGALAVLAIVFFFIVLVFRGCHNGEVEPDQLDPDSPLPGQEEIDDRLETTRV